MRRLKVMLTKNELLRQELDVFPWELPILQHVHGESNVSPTGEEFDDGQEMPSPEVEYARLDSRWGMNRETKQQRVATIYGVGAAGVKKLGKAMASEQEASVSPPDDDAEGDAEVAATPRTRHRRPRRE